MQYSKLLCLLSVLFFLTGDLNSQLVLPNYQVQKVEKDRALVKWEPRSPEELKFAFDAGYIVEIYQVDDANVPKLRTKDKVKVAAKNEWVSKMATNPDFVEYYQASAFLHYPELISDSGGQVPNGFIEGEGKIKLGLLQYYGIYDFTLSKMSGVAYDLPKQEGERLQVKVYTGDYQPFIFDLPATAPDRKVPLLSGKWGDEIVDLEWNTKEYRTTWFGYFLEKSSDEFGQYTPINEVPFVNNFDTSQIAELHFFELADSLQSNNVTYFYNLYGMDYFGKKSSTFSSISGEGYDKITMSPIIKMADQTENNEAHIKWNIPEEFVSLVMNYRVMVADDIGGDYVVDLDEIPSTAEEVFVPMRKSQNYYRVEAVPYKGEPVSSMPVFIMGMDTIPPAKPELLSATIDSTGKAVLSWKLNSEKDLWGYRIFWANFRDQEFSLLNATPILDSMYQDSVNLFFGTDQVFYKIAAYDERNNMSEYSEIVELIKPDLVPPSEAHINDIKSTSDSVTIYWQPSPSKDVVAYQLFRRVLNDEIENWTLIQKIDTSIVETTIIDTKDLMIGNTYAYTIVAFDKSGLKSVPCKVYSVKVKAKVEEFQPIESFDYVYDDQSGEVQLKWSLKDNGKLKHVLIYKGNSEYKMSKYKFIQGSDTAFTDHVEDGKDYFYFIKPLYDEQMEDYKSEVVALRLKESKD